MGFRTTTLPRKLACATKPATPERMCGTLVPIVLRQVIPTTLFRSIDSTTRFEFYSSFSDPRSGNWLLTYCSELSR